ncbi:MAG: methyltransferase domain-containing protein [Cyclobacteriaceae bacterium]
MNSILWQYFSDQPEFQIIDKSNSVLEFEPGNGFEELYLKLRTKEGRLYPDEVVKLLPEISSTHMLNKEWRIRELSAKKLASYLKAQGTINPVILDVGCGNGWLTNYLSTRLPAVHCGIDVNKTELEQAARLFGNSHKVFFVYGYISIAQLPKGEVDYILLTSSIQYFKNLNQVITNLLPSLTSKGEIHIMDSPIYKTSEVSNARNRTRAYFEGQGFGEMNNWYHHHTWADLESFNFKILTRPSNRIMRWISTEKSTPFPWIRITTENR